MLDLALTNVEINQIRPSNIIIEDLSQNFSILWPTILEFLYERFNLKQKIQAQAQTQIKGFSLPIQEKCIAMHVILYSDTHPENPHFCADSLGGGLNANKKALGSTEEAIS